MNDIPHDYVLYLFEQPDAFSVDVAAAQALYNPVSVDARMNFSIQGLAARVGPPVAATWIRAVNPDVTYVNGSANASATATAGAGNGTVGASATPLPFTGGAGGLEGGVGLVAFALFGTVVFALF